MSRILIVEDEEAIAELEKDYLELSGFGVEIENNGETGLKHRRPLRYTPYAYAFHEWQLSPDSRRAPA